MRAHMDPSTLNMLATLQSNLPKTQTGITDFAQRFIDAVGMQQRKHTQSNSEDGQHTDDGIAAGFDDIGSDDDIGAFLADDASDDDDDEDSPTFTAPVTEKAFEKALRQLDDLECLSHTH